MGTRLHCTSDLQSLIFTVIFLSGHELPWAAAAAAGDEEAVRSGRMAVSEYPETLPGVSQWPSQMRELAYAVVRGEERAVDLARAVLSAS